MYATYEYVRQQLVKIPEFEETSKSAAIAGFISGIPEALIVTPAQVVKVRLQAIEHLGKYNGPVDCIIKTYKSEGLIGFTRGLSPTLFRNCIWNAVYFGTMHWLKKQLPKPSSKGVDMAMTLVTGFAGATVNLSYSS